MKPKFSDLARLGILIEGGECSGCGRPVKTKGKCVYCISKEITVEQGEKKKTRRKAR